MTRPQAIPHVKAIRRVADKYVSRDGGEPAESAQRPGKPRIDRQAALALISDAEEPIAAAARRQGQGMPEAVAEANLGGEGVRHSWSEKSRPSELRTEQACVRCAIVRVTRHEGARHWQEFYDDAGMRLMCEDGRTPICEPVQAGAAA